MKHQKSKSTQMNTNITRQKLAEKALWEKNHQLGNLVKELNCLYGIANIVDQDDISLEEIFQEVVDEIPSSWQFPENTCARIIIQHKEWKTKNFQETIWKQASDIKVHGELRGILEVYCLEKPPEINEGPFLKEKTYLINAVAQRLGKVIERRSDEEKLQEGESQKRAILNASIDRIRYIDKDMKIIWANKTDRLEIGLLPKNIIGQFCYKICFGQDEPCVACPAIRARETRQTEHAVIYSPGKAGTSMGTRCWNVYSVPLIDETNEISGFINVIRDITEQNKYENMLQQSEERFRKIVENAPFGYFRIDKDGLWQYVNPEWERMHECSLQELAGKRFELMQPENLKAKVCEIVHRAMSGETIKGELQRRLKDGSFSYYVYNIQPVYQDSKIVAIEGFTNDLTARKHVEDLVRDLSQKLLQTQERERQMISYELHDSIAQNLSCMKINLDTFFKGCSDISPELIKKMKEFSNLTEQTLTAVRDLSYDLRPPGLDELGIVDALRAYCSEFYEKNGINVYFQPAGIDKLNMDIDTQVHLYRLIQEGLNNVRKHAGAGQVTIKLVGTPSNIILRIEDNGKGFDVKERERLLNNEKRMGLRSMQERVNLLHGQMKIESSQMKGTRIFIQIPNLEQGHEPKEKHINYRRPSSFSGRS